MRLIDADAISYVLVKGLTSTNKADKDACDIAYRYAIDNQPTIEAIPIEWLLEWEQKYNESLPQLFRGDTVIKKVIKEWREEHETD